MENKQIDLTNKCGSCKWAIPIKGSAKGVFGCHVICTHPNKKWKHQSSSMKQRTSPKCKLYAVEDDSNGA